jgi:hypothetical protein
LSGPSVDRKVDTEPATDQTQVCPICRQAWEGHNLIRARACSRALEEALALAEHRLVTISAPKRRLPDDILRISR